MAFAYGNGSYGCLFDHVDGPFNTVLEACEAAGELFELNEYGVRVLASDGSLDLGLCYDQPLTDDEECPRPVGADYIEIFEVDADWSCEP